MNNRKYSTLLAVLAIAALSSCTKQNFGNPGEITVETSGSMDILCFTGTEQSGGPAGLQSTKALISSTSSETMEANFVRIDDVNAFSAPETAYPRLSEAYVTEATIFAPSSLSGAMPLRNTVFEPEQHYRYEIASATTDTTFYKTRMVGWYPRTCVLGRDQEGQAATAGFDQFPSFWNDGTSTGITFGGMLDGQTDIMVSNMREGMHQSNAYHEGQSGAAAPFGSSNFFTFRHYLTAVRLYLQCSSSDLSLVSWGKIENVIFPDQPTSVTIRLPEEPGETFGDPVEDSWADPKDLGIITSAMTAGAETVSYPLSPVDKIDDYLQNEIYLGYMLVRPDMPTDFEIHTDAGVYRLEIPLEYAAADGQSYTLLEAGKIYNLKIDIGTDGSLSVFVGNDDEEKFKDLSPWNVADGRYQTANTYLINTADDIGADGQPEYGGYFFNAMQVGNGEKGKLNVANRQLYPADGTRIHPVSASILYQTQLNTVRNVELVDGHVRFILNEKCYDQNDPLQANAVIAVHDEEGNILWSWLIWVTREAKAVDFPDGGFSMLNMNLGANTAGPVNGDPLPTYGLYYQWGRKDPSPRPPSYNFDMRSMETIQFFGPNGEPVNYVSEFSSDENTIEDSARNPLLIMDQNIQGPNYAYDWLYYEIDQLWGESTKTIYDPCPYGYKVADDEIERLFIAAQNSSQAVTYQNQTIGRNIPAGTLGSSEAVFFPFAGRKGYAAGVPDKGHPWMEVGNSGDYQDARIRVSGHRSSSVLNGTGVSVGQEANRTSAAPVRCVRYSAESLE